MKSNPHGSSILRAQVAGSFYPGSAAQVEREVGGFLESARLKQLTGDIVALVAPHAGYRYSGATAGLAYRQVMGRPYDLVLVIGLAHRFPLLGMAIFPGDGVETPLGTATIPRQIADELAGEGGGLIELSAAPFRGEHSMEVQLPFVQLALPGVSIIPALMGHTGDRDCAAIGETIARVLGSRRALLVASTDLSHFPPAREARPADLKTLEVLAQFDPVQLRHHINNMMMNPPRGLDCVMCGEYPVFTTLAAARAMGATRLEVMGYANSADVSGDAERTVGYGAAVILRP